MGRLRFYEDEETGIRFAIKSGYTRGRGAKYPNRPGKAERLKTRRQATHEEHVVRPGRVAPETRAEVLAAGCCAFCGATRELTVDHIIPSSKGGGSHRANLQCLCGPCNRWKSDSLMSVEQFAQLPKRERRRIAKARARYHARALELQEKYFDKCGVSV